MVELASGWAGRPEWEKGKQMLSGLEEMASQLSTQGKARILGGT